DAALHRTDRRSLRQISDGRGRMRGRLRVRRTLRRYPEPDCTDDRPDCVGGVRGLDHSDGDGLHRRRRAVRRPPADTGALSDRSDHRTIVWSGGRRRSRRLARLAGGFFVLAGFLGIAAIALARELAVNPQTRPPEHKRQTRGFLRENAIVLANPWAR